MSISVDTVRDFDNGITTLRMSGELTFATAPTVRSALVKSASECPAAVIVDLDALDVASPDLVVVFPAAAQRASAQWGVSILLCCARPDVASRLNLFRTLTDIYDSPGSAMEAVRGGAPRWRRHRFPPVPGSAALARHLVAQLCAKWDLGGLGDAATLIVSELAGNAIEHAGTAFDVTVSHTTAYLRIAVRDGGPALPPRAPGPATRPAARDRGLGLYIVDTLATSWNATGVADGKIVWALLRIGPPQHRDGTDQIQADVGAHHDGSADGSLLPLSSPGQDLSDRETQVLGYLATMLTTGEIGAAMHVSVNTVKAHMRSVYHKLDVSRRRDAVLRAYERGLLP